ncbi:HAD hydrolase-like protein [Solibacillus ferritrahens]|uniref:HAD hydrolase-like protein n=1 Tax=Solibacillus ferritrahens TaxID=3098620 RepID=UPI003009B941
MQTAIIFDMDGTLFQTNLILEPALEQTFEYLRQNGHWSGATPIEQYRQIMGVPLNVVWETLCPDLTEEIREQSNEHFQLMLIDQIQRGNGALYPDVLPTLQKLSEHYPLYIASNGQTAYLQAIAAHYRLDRWIKAVYSIDCVDTNNKSHLVQHIMKEHHINNGYVVGDRASDINAAIDNNLTSIAVNFDFAQLDEIRNAHFVVDHFLNILHIIDSQHTMKL